MVAEPKSGVSVQESGTVDLEVCLSAYENKSKADDGGVLIGLQGFSLDVIGTIDEFLLATR